MPNENVLAGIKCPNCKSEGPFNIVATAWFKDVTDDGVTDFEDVEWDHTNNIRCNHCGRTGTVGGFQSPKATVTVYNVDIPLLRKQRDNLLTLEQTEEITGLTHLLDAMLDVAEGFKS